MEAWINKLYETFIETEYYKLLLEGLGNTLIITAGALVIGVVIGMLIALIKFFAEDVPSLRPLSFICDLYVTVIRGIPVVVLLLIFYYIIMVSAEGTAGGISAASMGAGEAKAARLSINRSLSASGWNHRFQSIPGWRSYGGQCPG